MLKQPFYYWQNIVTDETSVRISSEELSEFFDEMERDFLKNKFRETVRINDHLLFEVQGNQIDEKCLVNVQRN